MVTNDIFEEEILNPLGVEMRELTPTKLELELEKAKSVSTPQMNLSLMHASSDN